MYARDQDVGVEDSSRWRATCSPVSAFSRGYGVRDRALAASRRLRQTGRLSAALGNQHSLPQACHGITASQPHGQCGETQSPRARRKEKREASDPSAVLSHLHLRCMDEASTEEAETHLINLFWTLHSLST